MKKLSLLLGFLSCFICSCSNSEQIVFVDDGFVEEFPDLKNMVLMKSRGSTVVLGNSAPDANVNDRPAMNVKLGYDFLMSRHETTCDEFNALMKNIAGPIENCEDGSLPITNVTFFDAVLFANERSKSEGFDTAYSYLKKVMDAENHCVNLEGFEFHPESRAYRLPTEAEWIFAAVQKWNPQLYAWTADNSGYKPHQVCTLANENDICDLAGNAMEWVNDWFGYFRDITVSNYVGAPDGGSLSQRVVKGGSFRSQALTITLYGRGDVYTVTSSTRADYLGFRLVYGYIPNAVWMGSGGVVSTNKITPLANISSLYSYTKVYKTKLVFRNDETGNIVFIDYSNGSVLAIEIMDSLDAYHPEISPDGKRVAFCSGLEGVSGKSSLYVRDLNAEGTNLVKLNVESAAIPRWRVLENGDTVIVYVTDAGNNMNESEFKSASTWQVAFANGKFGKPQKLFDGAYHGGVSTDNRLAVTGARMLRTLVADSGKVLDQSAQESVWYNAEQACNVSLSQDGRKRTLFLDFAGFTGQKFVGERYTTHQRIFVVDSTGGLIQSVKAPLGTSFDHTEWAGRTSNIAVATLTNNNGAHSEIILVNMLDGNFVELVKGNELWHPNLWVYRSPLVTQNNFLDIDSAGVYMNTDDVWGAAQIRYNMELLWRYRDSINVAILGSSRPLYSLSPHNLSSDFFAVNFAHIPNIIYASRDYFKKYLLNHLKKLKYVVVSLDIDFWYTPDGSDNFFFSAYKDYPGYVYDENHEYWKDGYPTGLLECTENSISLANGDVYLEDRGHIDGSECTSWGYPAVSIDSTYYDDKPYVIENSLDALREIIELAREKDIYVVGMIFPQNPRYKETGAFGRYGMRRSLAMSLIDRFLELEKVYPNFRLLDENKMGNHDYSDAEAMDIDHLCKAGVPKITSRLDSLLKTLR